MNRDAFEQRLVELWVTTRVPFTRANLQFLTGAPRKKVEAWTKELTVDGVLESDVSDDGDMIYTVRGAERPRSGPSTVAEVAKLGALKSEVKLLAGRAATEALVARGKATLASGTGEKSLAVGAALSLFAGPLGWLYAGPWKTAVPAALVYLAAFKVLPTFLLLWLLPVVLPASALIGAAYTWRYNQSGKRAPILPEETGKK